MSSIRMLAPATLLLAAAVGCGSSARLINGSPDGGVVAIPSNSNYWPLKYRDEAEKLMAQRCPNGYEIVSEQEVVVGKTSTTNENVDRRSPTSSRYKVEQTSTSTTTSVNDQTEYRITFRARQQQSAVMQTSGTVPVTPPSSPLGGLPPRPLPITP
jgi:hypothetical protein